MKALSTKTSAKLFATGFTIGPLVDSLHNQCLLKYDLLPIGLEWPSTAFADAVGSDYPYYFCSSWTVPPLLGVAYVVLGGVLPRLFETILPQSGQQQQQDESIASKSSPEKKLQQRAILAVTTTALIIKLSEFLETNPSVTDTLFFSSIMDRPMAHFVVMMTAALSQWAILDGTTSALIAASVTSIGGPLSELPFVANGFWEYLDTASDYFPLANISDSTYQIPCPALEAQRWTWFVPSTWIHLMRSEAFTSTNSPDSMMAGRISYNSTWKLERKGSLEMALALLTGRILRQGKIL